MGRSSHCGGAHRPSSPTRPRLRHRPLHASGSGGRKRYFDVDDAGTYHGSYGSGRGVGPPHASESDPFTARSCAGTGAKVARVRMGLPCQSRIRLGEFFFSWHRSYGTLPDELQLRSGLVCDKSRISVLSRDGSSCHNFSCATIYSRRMLLQLRSSARSAPRSFYFYSSAHSAVFVSWPSLPFSSPGAR